ncbi:dUTPase [Staphylococcus microti]|uniref:dUTPase n=1 Tax=Staphylococcus microti TaxID=569857 RepID=A0A0D6XS96_9STAP|nr:dUTPase [Staphylococcus microti]KIX91462.1 dUTPase [Staphylococcus microti]PNZ82471.1 dUTPase [Staphylococcus microti]PNZ83656.1 dUTPase [Staphylococcus microti]SUM57040.1 Dimeric dUTPase [Staphylococcus microti]
MTNQLTVDQFKELLQIQKEFDDSIPTLNLNDSRIAYIVEFFEWFNTLETFKNWKKNPGKTLEVQLDELADMLAFGLSIANQLNTHSEDLSKVYRMMIDNNNVVASTKYILHNFLGSYMTTLLLKQFKLDEFEKKWLGRSCVVLPIGIAYRLYSIDQLIEAYKKKMERNHARQNGTTDVEKGYV